MVKIYNQRNLDEDLIYLESIGGLEALERKLKTSVSDGLNQENTKEMEERVEIFGINKKIQPELPHFCEFVLDALKDTMLQILIVAAAIQIIIGVIPAIAEDPAKDWIEGVSLIIAITMVVTVGSIVNYTKEKQFKELNDQKANKATFTVKRNGQTIEISEEEIVAGDVVKIQIGNIIPSDGVILNAISMKIDESALTGESDTIDKDSIKNCQEMRNAYKEKNPASDGKDHHRIPSAVIISGSQVTEGEGWMLAMGIGPHSERGKIQLQIINNQEDDDSKTPLELKLEVLAEEIGWFGIGAALCTAVALSIHLIISETTKSEDKDILTDPNAEEEGSTLGKNIIKIFTLSIAIVVAAIPEGMPLAVTLSLAFAVKLMMKENNLVRRMHSCETMGNANFICSDKTGTLTENKMTLNYIFDGKKDIAMASLATSSPGSVKPEEFFKNKDYYNILKICLTLNLDMEIDEKGEVVNAANTDKAFINALKQLGENLSEIIKAYYPEDLSELRKFPFKSDRKKMTVIIRNDKLPGQKCRVMMKGAAEIVLESCKYYLDPDTGSKLELNNAKKQEILDKIKEFGNKALRNIVVAYKDIDDLEFEGWREKDENGYNKIEKDKFVFICLAGIKDILRQGVEEAVSKCKMAGIKVVMITGDNFDTACAIATDCQILESSDDRSQFAIEGKAFYEAIGGITCVTCNLKVEKCKCPKTENEAKSKGLKKKHVRKEIITDMEAFTKITEKLKVIARSRVDDKYALILGLRKLNHIVAVTGDGTNDAKALSRADVGFAMGIMGTDIAKDAADIIILDDNFASIVNSVKWGRNIFDNIRKFIVFQLTVNVCSVILVFICVAVGNETPIVAIHMLWLNLIMDSLGSLSLATEPPHESILDRKPYNKDTHIINNKMWKHILLQAVALFVVCFSIYMVGHKFIVENEDYRIEDIDKIVACYGKYPGHESFDLNDEYLLMSGSIVNWSSDDKRIGSIITCGDYYNSTNMLKAYEHYKTRWGNTSHMTIVFNVFVLWSLFNEFNCRVIDDKLNIFYQIEKNLFFIIIVIAEVAAQALLIQFGGSFFKVSHKGLSWSQWLICLGFALLCFPVNFLLKVIPLDGVIEKVVEFGSWVIGLIVCRPCRGEPEEKDDDEDDEESEEKPEQELASHRELERKKSSNRNSVVNALRGKRGTTLKKMSTKKLD